MSEESKTQLVVAGGVSSRETEALRQQFNVLLGIMLGLCAFIAISFVIAIVTILNNNIRDKDLYLEYNKLYQNYSEQNSNLRDEISGQEIKISNLQNQIDDIGAFLKKELDP